jgi:hypothetical protein
MTMPRDKKDQAIYHTILSELHRVQGILLNLQTLDEASTAEGLRDHFTRDQTLTLGKVNEWKLRRPDIYRQASEDFQQQVLRSSTTST